MSPLDQIAVLGTNYCTVLCAKNQLYNQLYLVQPWAGYAADRRKSSDAENKWTSLELALFGFGTISNQIILNIEKQFGLGTGICLHGSWYTTT
jgi:acyl-CoA synthetase (AMP-forming)/AMP-acid ligase II